MTAPLAVQRSLVESFDERVEILTRELELAIQWNRACVLLILYNSEYVRADVESALENFLIESGQQVACIDLNEKPGSQVMQQMQDLENTENLVFFVTGSKRPPMQQASLFMEFDRHKDILNAKNIRLVFWLTQNEISRLAFCAPELWARRQRLIEFVDAPKPEQILQTAIETSWIGTGEFTDRFDDTEDKISLRESYLNELPQAAESTSTRADLLLTLGVLHWRKGDFEKAESSLREALKAAIQMEDSWFEAECYNAIALVKSSQGRHDEAIDDYKQAIHLAPEQIFVWNNLGNLCMKIMRNDEAMLAFQKALEQNQKDPVAWCGLGNVYYRIGYIDDSISAYRKAIEYAPTLAHPWNGLGDAYASVGRDIDAIASYQKAIEANRQFVLPWLRLADIYCRQGRNRDAIKAFQRALHVDSKNSQVWNELGQMYLKIESYEDAVGAFSKAMELDRGFAWACSNLALTHAKLGNHEEAINLAQKSLELFKEDSDKAAAWDQLANFYRTVSDYENAIHAYKMADTLSGHILTNATESASLELEAASVPSTDAQPEEVSTSANIQKDIEAAPPSTDSSAPVWLFTNTLNPNAPMVNDDPKGSLWTEHIIPRDIVPAGQASWKDESPAEEYPMPLRSSLYSHPITESVLNAGSEEKTDQPDFPIDGEEMTESINPTVWNEKGNIHFQHGAYEDAIRAYNKAIELDSSFGWPYSNLALTYLTLGKYAEAILLYQRSASLLETDMEKAAVWNSLGNIYRHLNDYENALKAYQKADDLDPENAGRRGNMDLSHFEPNSQNAQVWIELGNLFFKAGSYNEAVGAYEKAVKIDPSSGWAHSNLAMGFVLQSKYKEAVPLYLKSIELFTDDRDKATAWNRLGNVYRKMNDYENAKKAYQNAVLLSNEKTSLLTRTRFTLLGNVVVN
jgi:tetratricopeptide (TPR) repeat protein